MWPNCRRAVQIVTPDTAVRWHRRGFSLYWRLKSRLRRAGRPVVAVDIRVLIRQMHAANPLWGAPRIHGELRKLGIDIAQTTVAKYRGRRRGKPPSQTWRTFLANHVSRCASVDFLIVPTAAFRVLFVFVVLLHDRRRVVHVNVTAHPTAYIITTNVAPPDRRSGGHRQLTASRRSPSWHVYLGRRSSET
jgi:hypothetical protein